MRVVILIAFMLVPLAVFAQAKGPDNAEQRAQVTIFCAHPETDERIALSQGAASCPAGFKLFRNLTEAYVTRVDDAPLPIPQKEAVKEAPFE